MAISDSIVSELSKSSILLLSLRGVRTVLERELEIKDITIATDDTLKRDLARKGKDHYPHAAMVISDLIGIRDQNANRMVQKHGIRAGLLGATRATSRKAYMFPINVGLELKYADSDPTRAIKMAETMVILSMTGGLNFEIVLNDAIRFNVRIEIPESVSIPLGAENNAESPGAIEVTLNLIVHTYAGFFREVSAVNSGSPTRDMQIIMSDSADRPQSL